MMPVMMMMMVGVEAGVVLMTGGLVRRNSGVDYTLTVSDHRSNEMCLALSTATRRAGLGRLGYHAAARRDGGGGGE